MSIKWSFQKKIENKKNLGGKNQKYFNNRCDGQLGKSIKKFN